MFDGFEGEGKHANSRCVRSRQLSQNCAQRMSSRELVVAMRCNEQAAGALDAAPEEMHEVERGLICPVKILQHDDGGRIGCRKSLEQP